MLQVDARFDVEACPRSARDRGRKFAVPDTCTPQESSAGMVDAGWRATELLRPSFPTNNTLVDGW